MYKREKNHIEGLMVSYNEKGCLIKIENFYESWLQGPALFFYPENEQVFQDVTYEKTLKQGPEITYFKNGAIQFIINWKNGKKDGDMYEFYPNKSIKHHCHYKNDLKEGDEYEFYKTETLKEQCTYVNGLKEGSQIFYRKNKTKEKLSNGIKTKSMKTPLYTTNEVKKSNMNSSGMANLLAQK